MLLDYHPEIRVILPTEFGIRSVLVRELMPLAAGWTIGGGTQDYVPELSADT